MKTLELQQKLRQNKKNRLAILRAPSPLELSKTFDLGKRHGCGVNAGVWPMTCTRTAKDGKIKFRYQGIEASVVGSARKTNAVDYTESFPLEGGVIIVRAFSISLGDYVNKQITDNEWHPKCGIAAVK